MLDKISVLGAVGGGGRRTQGALYSLSVPAAKAVPDPQYVLSKYSENG